MSEILFVVDNDNPKLNLIEMIFFGKWYLLIKRPRSSMVRAFGDCSISFMMQKAFSSLAQHNAQSLMPILKILAKCLRSNLRLVEDLQDDKPPPAFLAIPLSLYLQACSYE
jgi:hypothetical protein